MWCHGDSNLVEFLTAEDVRHELHRRMVLAGSIAALARDLYVGETTLSLTLSGKRSPSAAVTEALGMVEVKMWQRKAEK